MHWVLEIFSYILLFKIILHILKSEFTIQLKVQEKTACFNKNKNNSK